MTHLRLYCAALVAWLFVFYNIERLHEPINLASFVYVMAAVSALAIILMPCLQRRSLFGLLGVLLAATLFLKWLWSYPLFGRSLPLTVTELGAMTLTVLLAHRFGRSLQEFREAVVAAHRLHWVNRSAPFESGQAEMFREVRRARMYERPLSLMAIRATDECQEMPKNRFLEEMQRSTLQHYTMARMADVISGELDQCAIVTFRGNHFVTLLPETGPQQAHEVAAQLESAVGEQLGLTLKVGISTFPDQEVTFFDLLEKAEAAVATPAASRNGDDRRNGHGGKAGTNGDALELEREEPPHVNRGIGREPTISHVASASVPEEAAACAADTGRAGNTLESCSQRAHDQRAHEPIG